MCTWPVAYLKKAHQRFKLRWAKADRTVIEPAPETGSISKQVLSIFNVCYS